MSRNAVILLSGGLDSATVLAIARDAGYDCHALSFDYGQRHRVELDAAAGLADALGAVQHVVIRIDLRSMGGSALTSDVDVPRDRDERLMGGDVPITYVPARNTIFLSFAVAYAEVHHIRDIFIGVNAVDYSGYPDCRPAFIEAFERTANLGTRAGVEGEDHFRIRTPLADLTKAQIIQRGVELGVDYSMTRSCYDPDESGRACGHCDSCQLRASGFAAAGLADPAL